LLPNLIFPQSTLKELTMTINLETAEKAARWGSAGFSLVMAVLSLVNLTIEARNGKPASEPTK